MKFTDYAEIERILTSQPYAAVLASSGELQFRRLQLIDKAVSAWDATSDTVEKNPSKKAWIAGHDDVLLFNEFGGVWFVPAEPYWKLYDKYKSADWADALAWTAAQHMPPTDECMTDCGLEAGIIDGPLQYWSRLPHGPHVKEALRKAIEAATYAASLACWDRDLATIGNGGGSSVSADALETIRSSLSEVTAPEKRDLLAELDEIERRCADFMPRRGITRVEAERELGQPVESRVRREGTLTVETVVFLEGPRRITADFVEGILVRYTVER